MPEARSWAGDKLVPQEILKEYNADVDKRIATAKSAAISAAEQKDQNVMEDVDHKIQDATSEVVLGYHQLVGDTAKSLNQNINMVNEALDVAKNESYERDFALTQSLQELNAIVERLPTIEDVNDTITTSLSTVYQFKGSVADYASLPSGYGVDQTGWVYNTEDTGMNYAWTGSGWDSLGGDRIVTQLLTATEYNSILDSGTIPSGAEGKLVGSDAYLAMRTKVKNWIPKELPLQKINTLSIPVSGWVEDSTNGGYTYSYVSSYSTLKCRAIFLITNPVITPDFGISLISVTSDSTGNKGTYKFHTFRKPTMVIPISTYKMENTTSRTAVLLYSNQGFGIDIYSLVENAGGGLKAVSDVKTGSISGGQSTINFTEEGIEPSNEMTYLLVISGTGEGISTVGYDYAPIGVSDETRRTLTGATLKAKMSSGNFNWQLFSFSTKDPSSENLLYLINVASDARTTLPITEGGTGAKNANNAILNLTNGLAEYRRTDNGSGFPGTGMLFAMKFSSQAYNISLATIRTLLVGSMSPIVDAQTDYDTLRARAISLHTSLPTTLNNGCIYGIYS